MTRKRIEHTPVPELLARFPDVSGNEVNGLGETEKRAASHFFWHPPEKQTHGELSAYVLQQFASHLMTGVTLVLNRRLQLSHIDRQCYWPLESQIVESYLDQQLTDYCG